MTVEGGAAAGADEALADELRSMDGVTSVALGDEYRADSGDLFYNVLTELAGSGGADRSQELKSRFADDDGVEVLSLTEEAERDARARAGLRLFVDVFAAILACIGISDGVLERTGQGPRAPARGLPAARGRNHPQAGEKRLPARHSSWQNPSRGQRR